MNLNKGMGKAKELLGKPKGVFAAFARAMINAFDSITAVLRSRPDGKAGIMDRFLQLFKRDNKRPFVFILGGLVVLFLILIITVFSPGSGKSKKPPAGERAGTVSSGPIVPQEDIFMPAEPDFLPAFIFERSPRHSWTIEDIRPYWKSHEKTGQWQKEIKSAVDKLMEGVP